VGTNAELSAAEAYVLLSLPRFDVRQALKLGFIGLLAQRALRLSQEDRPGLIRTRHIVHLHVATNLPVGLSSITASLIAVVRAAEPEGLMKEIVSQSMRKYGRALVGFVQNYVGPALAARGLAEKRKSRLLGLLPLTRFYRTPAGDAEKQRIEGLMQEARSIPRYLDSDPAQAAALVTALGGAILLIDELRPHYQALDLALRDRNTGSYTDTPNWDTGDHQGGLFDFGSIDFSAFDAGAFDSFDAGFSDAGGDGGGDGGNSGC
jgi:hypothetical protein